MEFRQMRCFATLAEELHFGRAAATLSMAQPALSVQIQTLEKELGVQLLIRSTRRVQLTKAGEVFYERCINVLREIENSSAIVRAVAGKNVDRITIGTIYPATFGVLPLFLNKLGKRFPDIQIHVSSGSTDAIIRDLEKGRINLGFIRPVENIGSLRWQSIANERYLLAVPLGSRLETAETVTMSDLKRNGSSPFPAQIYLTRKSTSSSSSENLAFSIRLPVVATTRSRWFRWLRPGWA